MYRTLLFLAVCVYCSFGVPFGLGIQQQQTQQRPPQPLINQKSVDVDIVDNVGGGYSFFKKQPIESRPISQPTIQIPMHDLHAYMQSSSLTHQAPIKESFQNFVPQQKSILQKDFSQPETSFETQQQTNTFDKFPSQPSWTQQQKPIDFGSNFGNQNQQVLPPVNTFNKFPSQPSWTQQQQPIGFTSTFAQNQKVLPSINKFNTIPSQDSWAQQQKPIGFSSTFAQNQQVLSPVNTFNKFPSQSSWTQQQKPAGFGSSFGTQNQLPISQGFSGETVQQMNPVAVPSNTGFGGEQRFISQSKPKFNGW